MPIALIYSLLAVNLAALALFGYDKAMAKSARARLSERFLLICAAVGGSVGALFGMVLFNHKTAKPAFRFGIPVILAAQTALWWWSGRW